MAKKKAPKKVLPEHRDGMHIYQDEQGCYRWRVYENGRITGNGGQGHRDATDALRAYRNFRERSMNRWQYINDRTGKVCDLFKTEL